MSEYMSDDDCFDENSNYGFDNLPMELIIEILKHLQCTDRNAAGLTCKRWFSGVNYYKFLNNIVVNFDGISLDDNSAALKIFLANTRVFKNFNFSVVKFGATNSLFKHYGETVEELLFRICILRKKKLFSILKYLPNLRSLSIEECSDLFRTWKLTDAFINSKVMNMKFEKLNSFSLARTKYLIPPIFDRLIQMMPNLEYLNLSNCFITMDAPSRSDILNHLLTYIRNNQNKLKALQLNGTPIDDLFWLKLSEMIMLKLEALTLTYCGKISPQTGGILSLLRMQSSIEHLDLTDSLGLTDQCLIVICKNMPQLKTLKIRKCWMITDYGACEIIKLRKLKVLDISNCERITDTSLLQGFAMKVNENISELYISLLTNITEKSIFRLADNFRNLSVLDVSGSSNCITDISAQKIFESLIYLRSLNLDCCGKITDDGLIGAEITDINDYHYITGYSISLIRGLRILKLSGCYKISDKSLEESFKFNELREISLARCQLITEQGIEHLVLNCPSIEVIDLTECQNITDNAIELISLYSKRLKTLKVFGCTQLTNRSLDSIQQNCKYIKNLHIRGCFQMTSDPATHFKAMTCLKNIYAH